MSVTTASRLRVPASLNALRNIIVFLMKSPTSLFGLAVLALLILVAIFAPLIATHDPYAQDLANTLQAPGNGHLFGTDELGRDIFSRLVWGSRITLTIIFLVSIVVGPIGLAVGAASELSGWSLRHGDDAYHRHFPVLPEPDPVAGLRGCARPEPQQRDHRHCTHPGRRSPGLRAPRR